MSLFSTLISLGLIKSKRKVIPRMEGKRQIIYIRFDVNTDKAKYLKVGMKVVLNDERREYAHVVCFYPSKNVITVQPLYPKEYTEEEKSKFPLRVLRDTKQYLK